MKYFSIIEKYLSKYKALVLIGIFLIIYFVYSPITKGYFLTSDDYLFFSPQNDITKSRWDSNIIFKSGLPLMYLINKVYSNYIVSINDANFIRFLSIIGLSIFCFINWLWFRKNKINNIDALMIIIIISCMPAVYLSVSWIHICVVYGLICSSLAAFFVNRGILKKSFFGKMRMYTLSIIFILVSLMIYQINAMYYWVMVSVIVFGNIFIGKSIKEKSLAPYYFIGFISMFIYSMFYKVVLPFVGYATSGRSDIGDIFSGFKWLLVSVMPMALNFNSIKPNIFITISVSSIIIIGIILKNKTVDGKQNYDHVSVLTKWFNNSDVLTLVRILTKSIILLLIFLLLVFISHKSTSPIYFDKYSLKSFLIIILLSSLILIGLYINIRFKLEHTMKRLLSISKTIDKRLLLISKTIDKTFSLTTQNYFHKIVSIVFLVFMCHIFRIITYNDGVPDFRSIIVIGSLFVVLFYFCLINIKSRIKNKYQLFPTAIFLLICIISIYRANFAISNYIVYPQTYEAKYMKQKLQDKLNPYIKNIHIFRPNWWSGMVPFKITPGTEIGLLNSSVHSNIKEMVLFLLKEVQMGNGSSDSQFDKEAIKRISITSSTKGEPIDPKDKYRQQEPNHDSTSLFIDMTPLVYR